VVWVVAWVAVWAVCINRVKADKTGNSRSLLAAAIFYVLAEVTPSNPWVLYFIRWTRALSVRLLHLARNDGELSSLGS